MSKLKKFGEYLFQLRMDRGMSLAEVGKKVGISANYVGQLERAEKENPSDEVLRNLSKVYDIPEERLFSMLERVPLAIKEELEEDSEASAELQYLLSKISLHINDLPEEKKETIYRKVRKYYDSLID